MTVAPSPQDFERFLARKSFIELGAADRAAAILDPGTARVLLGPFDRLTSPWLPLQGITPQSDDGVTILRGQIDGAPAMVASIESRFKAAAWARCRAPRSPARLS